MIPQQLGAPSELLTSLQPRLAEAEFDHKVVLQQGTKQEFTHALSSMWHGRMFVNKLSKYIGAHQDRVPKSKEERINAMLDILRRTS